MPLTAGRGKNGHEHGLQAKLQNTNVSLTETTMRLDISCCQVSG
ncbi:hypothetical protein BN2537_12059 [Streptomyces venezuelae]|nr:hypothetical protein BN2537_12059 [Streptomyces venezuelae]